MRTDGCGSQCVMGRAESEGQGGEGQVRDAARGRVWDRREGEEMGG